MEIYLSSVNTSWEEYTQEDLPEHGSEKNALMDFSQRIPQMNTNNHSTCSLVNRNLKPFMSSCSKLTVSGYYETENGDKIGISITGERDTETETKNNDTSHDPDLHDKDYK